MSAIHSAYHINLTPGEKELIGELAAIQSQIEWLMQAHVRRLLAISHETSRVLMGSTSIQTVSEIWIRIIREKERDAGIREWAEYAYRAVGELSKGRNDFLHAVYGIDDSSAPQGMSVHINDAIGLWPLGKRKALRVKNAAPVPIADLRKIRERAAWLSIVFAHVEWDSNDPAFGPSPWLEKLGPTPPPSSPKAALRKDKARPSPPQS